MNEEIKKNSAGGRMNIMLAVLSRTILSSFPIGTRRKGILRCLLLLPPWISYGRREPILRKANELHDAMGLSPYRWIRNEGYKNLAGNSVELGKRDTFYRFYTYSHLRQLCDRLKSIYEEYDSLEDALSASPYPESGDKDTGYFLRNRRDSRTDGGRLPVNVLPCSSGGWSGKMVLSTSASGKQPSNRMS